VPQGAYQDLWHFSTGILVISSCVIMPSCGLCYWPEHTSSDKS
jgi:hypothetical protein